MWGGGREILEGSIGDIAVLRVPVFHCFVHHNSRCFSLGHIFLSASSLLHPPLPPPSLSRFLALSFSLSHLHRALRTCLRAMTRAIEYSTFACSPSFSSFHPRANRLFDHLSTTHFSTILRSFAREQTRTQKKYL